MDMSGQEVKVKEYSKEIQVPEDILNVLEDNNLVVDFSKTATPRSVSRAFDIDDVRVVIRINEHNEVFYIRTVTRL